MCDISILTTWQSKCGIYEYSRYLVQELLDTMTDIKILGNYGDYSSCLDPLKERYSIHGDRIIIVPRCFGVYWWDEPLVFNVDKIYKEAINSHIFHVQYHSSLFKHPEFMNLLEKLKGKVGKLVVTLHDSSRHSNTNLNIFDDVIYHKQGILHEKICGNKWLLPYPIQHNRPTVFSFGMGRNDYRLIENACNVVGANFDFHDSRINGWLSEKDLYKRIKDADAVVLWYNEVPIVGASAAVRTALSAYRPVIVNDVGWFSDVSTREVTKVKTLEGLTLTLHTLFHTYYSDQNSFKALARKHMEIYNS